MSYMMWYDDDPQRPIAQKIAAAIETYVARFREQPTVVLVNTGAEQPEVAGVSIEGRGTVPPDHFWVGPVSGTARGAPMRVGV